MIPLGLASGASAADAGIHKKILNSYQNTTTVDEMEDIPKTVKSVDSGFLLKAGSETVQKKVKK